MLSLRPWLVLAMFGSSCVFAQSADDSPALAERFVRAMQLDEQSAVGLRIAADKMRNDGKINDAQVVCIKQTKGAEYLPVMKQIAAAQLTAEEMQEAIQFFESSAGKKYLQMSAVKTAEMAGVNSEAAMPDFTPKEYDATNEFGTTKLFQKLVIEAVMTRSAVARPLILNQTLQIMQRCLK